MNRTFSVYVLPIVLFVVLVGGITWVVQFMPSWRSADVTPKPGPADKGSLASREMLRFSRPGGQFGDLRAVWELDSKGQDTGYVLEHERSEQESHYYFPFRNMLDAPVELGLGQLLCGACSSADACVLPAAEWESINAMLDKTPWAEPVFAQPPSWHHFTASDFTGMKVPANGQGLLRVNFHGRTTAVGERLKIDMRFWAHSDADSGAVQNERVMVPVVIVPPVMFEPIKLSAGVLGPNDTYTGQIHFWSATRDDPDVSFQPASPDPLFRIESRRLSAEECRALAEKLSGGKEKKERPPRRVRAAYLVTATVYERKGDRQMDQGPFSLSVPLKIDQLAPDLPFTPTISGLVRGDVDVGGSEDQGKVQLRTFPANEDKVLVVPVFADPKAKLELVSQSPNCLKVTLKANPKESTPQRAQWDLRVTVPAGSWNGPMPDSAHVMLRVAGQGTPRQVRIPVVGIATRGR